MGRVKDKIALVTGAASGFITGTDIVLDDA
jgi:NADP-dependent 3-hydroxy acid dehydrogenase YdfG